VKRLDRARLVGRELDRYFPEVPIPLHHTDAYTLLIAVLLSAQCTDKRVNLVTPGLFARASSAEQMVKLSVNDIQSLIQTCGLAPQKAKAIHRLSGLLIERYGGQVPASFQALEALPGVGHKTASVVMAQAFGIPAFPVDTHIHRLARKWRLSRARNVLETERDLKKCFPEQEWNKRHLQIIFYGREYSPARGKKADACPITRLIQETERKQRQASKSTVGSRTK